MSFSLWSLTHIYEECDQKHEKSSRMMWRFSPQICFLSPYFCPEKFWISSMSLTKLMVWFLTSNSEKSKNSLCRFTKKALPIFEISEKKRHNSAKTILSITTKKMSQQSQAIFFFATTLFFAGFSKSDLL